MRSVVIGLFGLLIVSLAAPARAGEAEVVSITARGAAPESAGDARTRALDEAFASAVESAVAQVTSDRARTTHAATLREHVIRRARLLVASYRIDRSASVEGQLQLTVLVRVDMGKLRARLDELGIGEPGSENGTGAAGPRPKVVVLVHATLADQVHVSFGEAGTDGGAPGRALATALRDRGFDVVATAGLPAPVATEVAAGLPVSDAGALAVAQQAGAGAAFVVGLQAQPAGTIRGTPLLGAQAVARLRVVEPGAAVASAEARGAGFGGTATEASERAAGEAAALLIAQVAGAIAAHWPAPAPTADGVRITLGPIGEWETAAAVLRELERAAGVTAVWPRAFSRGRVTLVATGNLDSRRVAAILRTSGLDTSRYRVGVRGTEVVIQVAP